MTDEVSDLVVLGAGSGGYAAALRAAQLGLSVTLIERDLVGGTCLHRGCVPTKALLHAGELADAVRDGASWGVNATLSGIDAAAMLASADKTVARLHTGLSGLIRQAGIRQVSGDGTLVHDAIGSAVLVDGVRYRGETIVLATGAMPRELPGLPADGDRILTSDQALRLESIPSSVAVVGGGVIGVEFASLWRSLGAEVHILEVADRVLPEEDRAVSEQLGRALRSRGVKLHLGTELTGITTSDDTARVTLTGGEELQVDVVLIAVGRIPNSAALDGVEQTPTGHVVTDDRLHTSMPGVVAVGDLVSGPQLAHRGFAHGVFVADEVAHRRGLLERRPVPPVDHELPRIVYSDPQVASVGLSEDAARRVHGEVEVHVSELGGNARAQLVGGRGMIRLIRVSNGPVVGISAVGPGVGELMGESQLIVGWGAHPDEVAALIHPHPTLTEALGEAHLSLAGRPLHQH